MEQRALSFGELVLDVLLPKFLSFMLVVTQVLITITIGLTVFFRYILRIDFYSIEEFILIFAFWLYMMGGAYGSFDRSHIAADIVSEYIKDEKWKLRLKFIVSLITTIICLIINYWAYHYLVWGIVKGATTIAWRIPLFIPQSSIFVGFTIMSIYSFRDLLNVWNELVTFNLSLIEKEKKYFSANNAKEED